jgi:hypothetical protein
MGNGAVLRPGAPARTPCAECRHYGGRAHAESPHGTYVICDSPNRAGAFQGDPDSGCRFWEQAGGPREGKRIIVCGGRGYTDRERVNQALDAAHAKSPIAVIVHGGASGADTLAKLWAQERGILREEYPARWHEHGRAAGPVRNQQMADCGADGCIAFPGGRGTTDMVRRAQEAGIPVWKPFG